MPYTPSVSVGALLSSAAVQSTLDLEVLGGADGLDRRITVAPIQKTGLALAGFDRYLHPGRLLMFGHSEVDYLSNLASDERRHVARRVVGHDLPGIVLTAAAVPPAELVDECNAARTPLLRTRLSAPVAMSKITALLEDRLAPREIVHGVLMDILGLGVLVVGESGIGKSESCLDLIVQGHRLVADDAVEVRRRAESVLIGTCPELTRHHMEIRGIGVINVRDMFGVASTRRSKRIEYVVQLERWEPNHDYERLGLDDEHYSILGLAVSTVRIPVAPGRNLARLIEVAARNQLLRQRGQHAARQLVERADRRLRGVRPGPSDETDEPDTDQ